jgi:hypothetical protein
MLEHDGVDLLCQNPVLSGEALGEDPESLFCPSLPIQHTSTRTQPQNRNHPHKKIPRTALSTRNIGD